VLTLNSPALAEPLNQAYATFREMLQMDRVVFGTPETPLGASKADFKRYVEFDAVTTVTVPPALQRLRATMISIMDEHREELEEAALKGIGASLADVVDRQRGPMLRLTWYPPGRVGEVNQPHTDIDLFTLLPAATRPGLEIRSAGKWQSVETAESEMRVLPGELLQYLRGTPPAEHRVVSDGCERLSASMFVNADPSLPIGRNRRVADIFEERLAAVRRQGGEENA
jgi:hypothetical protein